MYLKEVFRTCLASLVTLVLCTSRYQCTTTLVLTLFQYLCWLSGPFVVFGVMAYDPNQQQGQETLRKDLNSRHNAEKQQGFTSDRHPVCDSVDRPRLCPASVVRLRALLHPVEEAPQGGHQSAMVSHN